MTSVEQTDFLYQLYLMYSTAVNDIKKYYGKAGGEKLQELDVKYQGTVTDFLKDTEIILKDLEHIKDVALKIYQDSCKEVSKK